MDSACGSPGFAAVRRGEASRVHRAIIERCLNSLPLKAGHDSRPLWVCENHSIVFERFSPFAEQVQDFLIAIAEPVSRPEFIHEYQLTTSSLYAAASVGLKTAEIIDVLSRFSKTPLPPSTIEFIRDCTVSYGKVQLVLKNSKYFIESKHAEIIQRLLKDPVVGTARATADGADAGSRSETPARPKMSGVAPLPANRLEERLNTEYNDDEDERSYGFQIDLNKIDEVKKRCNDLGFPMLQEYDFRKDVINRNLNIRLTTSGFVRPYQETSLRKMFGNGRARSGIIVLPCGAGKTLVGVMAAGTINKSCLVLCTSAVSAGQWRHQFKLWAQIKDSQISLFTSEEQKEFQAPSGVLISTYSMIANTRKRSRDAERKMEFVSSREWGLVILDEVHVVPANTFRLVFGSIKAHAKLGLTATLVREDDKIVDLDHLIGPKLYEANWKDLAAQGHIANVLCAEVQCPMSPEFYHQYLRATSLKKTLLHCMNPTKLQACQYLMDYHERRGDKIIVFSDNVFALEYYARKLKRLFIHGKVSQVERELILERFKEDPDIKTIFLSKVGDTSLDIPEATCLIQISSHFGSRRQEAQRLGRILRAKRRSEEGFNAYFYSLVSKDTDEMVFSTKRQQFLVDQGYAFKVITRLDGIERFPGLAFRTIDERWALLREVYHAQEKDGETGNDVAVTLEVA
ncbi:TFIIH basal transcription factor complex helicase XPB subunit [Auricularia subglabra TFB-10046 SS5]|uniref:DNA 3'-5' helicase n=1 Tax=Auricularia subglabra (strain TFB-10046 / SS5) TaxID=717982 RepID=J0D9A1_AURST|nr:TFIIH basal transcription factor complex helicase XPB subunit [Auricularia subglabra TFB-10046 SS5]